MSPMRIKRLPSTGQFQSNLSNVSKSCCLEVWHRHGRPFGHQIPFNLLEYTTRSDATRPRKVLSGVFALTLTHHENKCSFSGARIDTVDEYGWTPVHTAASVGNVKVHSMSAIDLLTVQR